MKTCTILLLTTLSALAQNVPVERAPGKAGSIVAPKMELRLNRPAKTAPPGVKLSSPLVEAMREGSIWQWVNPFAPARYGDGWANVSFDPVTGRGQGVKLVSIRF
jgi:hypothetical protein